MAAIIGISPTEVTTSTTTPAFRLGSRAGVDHPTNGYQEFVYGRAKGAITGLGYVCVETTDFDFAMVTVTLTTAGTAGFGSRLAVPQAAMLDNTFGWFQIYGKGTIRTTGAAAIGTRLNTTGTAGTVDDDATGGSEAIFGLVLLTATGGAAAGADAILTYPTVGTTL
jgi:hypothetical protein